jgi:predicted aspartyl protease
MKREWLWWGRFGRTQLLLILIFLESRSVAQALVAIAEGNGPELSGVEESGEIPFTLYDGYLIVVEGRIGAQRHLKLMLDTGATHSVLRSALAKGKGFVRRPVRIVNLDQLLRAELVEVPDFQLGPIRIPLLPMMLNELEYLLDAVPGIDGIIGLDALRGRSFTIDLGKRKIAFGPSRALRSSARMEVDTACLAVEVRILNQPVHLVVDTGVRATVLYRDRLGDRLPELKVEEKIQAASLGGNAPLDVVTLPVVQLNGFDLRRRVVVLRSSPKGFLPAVDGYLSLTAFGVHRFAFDLRRNVFSWE